MRRFPIQWGIPLGFALLLIAIGVLSGSAANAQYPSSAPAARGNPAAQGGSLQGNLGLPAAPAIGTPCSVTTTLTGSLDSTDMTETQRLTHSVNGSTCALAVAC